MHRQLDLFAAHLIAHLVHTTRTAVMLVTDEVTVEHSLQ